jgi:hypothetical protein
VTPDEARRAIYDEFLDQWDQGVAALELEGEPFKEPGPGASWARLSFRQLGGGQLTLGPTGSRKYRRRAGAFVQVFVPATQGGMRLGASLAHDARAILEGRRVSGVEFDDGQVSEIPLRRGEKSRQFNVEVRCTYDETK